MKEYTVADTKGLSELILDSQGRNRSAPLDFIDELDPDGMHVVSFTFVHNDVELRSLWLTKVTDNNEPVMVYLDNSFEAFQKWSFHQMKKEVKDMH